MVPGFRGGGADLPQWRRVRSGVGRATAHLSAATCAGTAHRQAVMYGAEERHRFGLLMGGVGDIDLDGCDDFIITAHGRGRAYVYFASRQIQSRKVLLLWQEGASVGG